MHGLGPEWRNVVESRRGGYCTRRRARGGGAWSRGARAGARALVDLVHCRALAAPTGLHKGRHNFRVDELYWFRFLPQGTDAYGVFFAGQVTRVAPKTFLWNWCLERTPAQRSINALCDEGTEKLTESSVI